MNRGLVRRLTRSIDRWWPVNWSTAPQEPAQTATSFPALSSTSTIAAPWYPAPYTTPSIGPPKSMNTIKTNREGTPDKVLKLRSARGARAYSGQHDGPQVLGSRD